MALKKFWRSTIIIWSFVFLVINIDITEYGGTNAMSRFAALRAITESGELNIDKYRHWTIDWSKSPNGHYYSNKAPGSILLAFPTFWLLDSIALIWDQDNKEPSGIRGPPGQFQKKMLSFVGQVIPLLILLYFLTWFFISKNYGSRGNQWMVAAILFGSTASIFMNSWFGHGFAAILYLSAILLLLERRSLALGFVLGALVLSDYSAALFVGPFVAALFLLKQVNTQKTLSFCFGVLPCFALWCWYHKTAFGGIFSVAPMFINPMMQNLKEGSSLFGVVGFWPNATALYELLFGGARGVLVTQPWALVLIVYSLIFVLQKKLNRQEWVLSGLVVTNFLVLYLFNASVGEWHAGHTAGPRYLSVALLGLAVLIPIYWDKFSWHGKWLTGITIIYAIVFRGFVYGTTILAPPPQELWPWMLGILRSNEILYLRIGTFFVLIALATWRVYCIEQGTKPEIRPKVVASGDKRNSSRESFII